MRAMKYGSTVYMFSSYTLIKSEPLSHFHDHGCNLFQLNSIHVSDSRTDSSTSPTFHSLTTPKLSYDRRYNPPSYTSPCLHQYTLSHITIPSSIHSLTRSRLSLKRSLYPHWTPTAALSKNTVCTSHIVSKSSFFHITVTSTSTPTHSLTHSLTLKI